MTKLMTERDYTARINRVTDYISANLEKRLTIKELAEIAAFSSSHFHHVFRTVVGESVKENINRIRLEKAAQLLIHNPHLSITEIGMECGFSSSAHFAQSFRKHFACSAREFREIGFTPRKFPQKSDKKRIRLHDKDLFLRKETYSYRDVDFIEEDVKIRKVSSFNVAYLRLRERYYSFERIIPLFKRLTNWASVNDLMDSEMKTLGVYHDDPYITPFDKCRFDVCVSVPSGTKGVGEIGSYEIQTGNYLMYGINGTPENIFQKLESTVRLLIFKWLPNSGLRLDERPHFDIWPDLEDGLKRGKLRVLIYLSVKW
jgi:AraC family transcriptional regulator